ncbi:hypothetical protein [Cytobacillus massiliigabonensis]|uniref:hypothetical protein n=1 Tax=Cytobacillus massiliigabonensis TaxID=1871011 RepID=UPI000C832988|nr:hypothetical protein [Cytobacillus massiliigabonensis]
MLFSVFSKKYRAKDEQSFINMSIYKRVLGDIEKSKYCSISEEEMQFIYQLILKLFRCGETKSIRLTRMSNKAISVTYNTYPIGKVRLQGRKTWMQILIDLYEYETLEGNLNDYIDGIDHWILYIKKHLNAT